MEQKEEPNALVEPVVGEERKLNLFQSILMDDEVSLNELLDERTNKFILRLRNRDALSRTPLYYASQLGKTDIVDRLLKTGACNIEDADADGWTCLFVSCLYGKKDIVKLLLKNEAKTEAKEEKYGWTPLFAATCKDEVEIVKMLLQEGADVNVTDKTGRTPLWIAVMLEHTQIIHELIKHGASVNCTDDKGRTPAYIAVQMEKKKALAILLDNNANLDLADVDNRTPLILSYKLRFTDIQEYLQERGADQTALEKEKQEEEESKFGPCRGNFVKNYKTNGAKIHCLTNTPGHVWGGTTDGSIFVWDLTGELIAHVEKLLHNMVDMISVEDEVWALTEMKDISVMKLNSKYLSLKKKPDINDRKWIETTKVPTEELESIGCLMNYKDKSVYGGSINNTIYCWNTKIKPYPCQKVELKAPESNPEPFRKILSTKDHLFVAKNRLIHVFSSEHVYQYTLEDHTDRVTAMVEAQGKLWTASYDASIRVWDVEKKSCISVLDNAHEGEAVLCLAAAGNAQVISGGKDHKIKSRSAKTIPLTREREKEFPLKHEFYIECLLWEPKTKQLWAASFDKSVSIWS